MFGDSLSDNDYRIISDSIQSDKNLRRKSNLNNAEINACLIGHMIEWIDKNKKELTIATMMDKASDIREELSLSKKGHSMDVYKSIMSREMRDIFKKKKDKDIEVD